MSTKLIQNELTHEDKQDIIFLVNEACIQMGSDTAFANRCGVSPATISQIKKNQYPASGDKMWMTIANVVGWRRSGWVVVPDTTNTRIIHGVLEDAKTRSMFVAIADRAGMGKSASLRQYAEYDRTKNTFMIECWQQSPKEFLNQLRSIMGLPIARGMFTVNEMLDQIIRHFEMRKGKPLLIIDQANSLPHNTFAILIHLYNRLEDRLGCVISGTENLQIKIERGVHNKYRGYDELEDRFGRAYVHLVGYTFSDVKKICDANGITDDKEFRAIWQECGPISKSVMNEGHTTTIKIVESGRVLKRKIIKYLMFQKLSEPETTPSTTQTTDSSLTSQDLKKAS